MEHSSSQTPVSSASGFDPYQQWLGLSTGHTANHYELLGVVEFTDAAGVIATGFETRFQQIRRYEVGLRSDEALKILQHLSVAYAILSDPQQKRDYDDLLRTETGRDTDVSSVGETLRIESATVAEDPSKKPAAPRDSAVAPRPARPSPPPPLPRKVAPVPEESWAEPDDEDDSPSSKRADVSRHLYVGFLSLLAALLSPLPSPVCWRRLPY
ncbi:MAG: hypothetical protein CMJ64_04775 [Planctomycetaceae bacterium]|nr:hypothetical protein [Planctomycetaceae bacterium]